MTTKKSQHEYKLSAEEKQFYADNGYLVLRGFFDAAACDNLRTRFIQVVNREVPRGKIAIIDDKELKKTHKNPEDHVNKINQLSFDPEFMKYNEDPRLVDVLSQLTSSSDTDGTIILNSMLINKPPGTPWHPPHQDMYHVPLRPTNKVVTTWTAIDEATQDNGCLFVIPGSHKANVIHEEHILPDFVNSLFFTIKDLETDAPKDKRVALPMKTGDTVFMNSLLVHGSYPNSSEKYRKAITCVYACEQYEFVDVRGSVQEPFMAASLAELARRGYKADDYEAIWRSRSKKI